MPETATKERASRATCSQSSNWRAAGGFMRQPSESTAKPLGTCQAAAGTIRQRLAAVRKAAGAIHQEPRRFCARKGNDDATDAIDNPQRS